MKKLIMILGLVVVLSSCTNTPTEVKNPKQETTIELQQLASIDSLTYKVVEKDDTVYILSTKDNIVLKKIRNHSGALMTSSLIFTILILIILILWILAMTSL
jgi:PBP1b-binding outer membrane lipoprotein LpoB